MPESKLFLETYLREIGVHTPVSLFAFEGGKPKQHIQSDTVSAVDAVHQDERICNTEVSPDSLKTLDELSKDASTCRLCSLAETRSQVVFGIGNAQADLLLIGETPGRDEDIKGEPFVGIAGQLLDRMLHAIGMNRESVYIMNTIKCRPPNNRDPRPDEVRACNLWFEQQLDIVQPKMICLLGRVAAQTVLKTDEPLASLRGRWHDFKGIPVWVTYHPAYLLRSPRQKQKSWQDLIQLNQGFQALYQPDL